MVVVPKLSVLTLDDGNERKQTVSLISQSNLLRQRKIRRYDKWISYFDIVWNITDTYNYRTGHPSRTSTLGRRHHHNVNSELETIEPLHEPKGSVTQPGALRVARVRTWNEGSTLYPPFRPPQPISSFVPPRLYPSRYGPGGLPVMFTVGTTPNLLSRVRWPRYQVPLHLVEKDKVDWSYPFHPTEPKVSDRPPSLWTEREYESWIALW